MIKTVLLIPFGSSSGKLHPAASASLDVDAPSHRGKMDSVNSAGVAPVILGRGHFAVVELVSHAAVEEHYALKTVAKQRFLEVMKQRSSSISVRTESLMLRILQHRRIIRMLGCWEMMRICTWRWSVRKEEICWLT